MKILNKIIEEKSDNSIKIPRTKLNIISFSIGKSGEATIKLKNIDKGRVFTIKTDGNLKSAHKYAKSGKKPNELSKDELNMVAKEIKFYIENYGNEYQKKQLKGE